MWSFEQIRGDTWAWSNDSCCIPVFFLRQKQVVLMDSGSRKADSDSLLSFLCKEGLTVRAVLTSHAHIDHTGTHSILQARYGAELYASLYTAAVLDDALNLKAYFYEDTYQEFLRHQKLMCCHTDQLILPGQTAVEVDGARFDILALPGHAPDHLGFVTPDCVCYLADLLLTDALLSTAKLPYTMCLGPDLKSKAKAYQMSYADYLLAHCGHISPASLPALAECNIRFWRNQLALVMDQFHEDGQSLEQTISSTLQMLQITCMNSFSWMAAERTIRAMVNYLVDTGALEKQLTGTGAYYRKRHNAEPLSDTFLGNSEPDIPQNLA